MADADLGWDREFIDNALKELGHDPDQFWRSLPGRDGLNPHDTLQHGWDRLDRWIKQSTQDPAEFWKTVPRPLTPSPAPSPSPTPSPAAPGWLQPGGRDPMDPVVVPGGVDSGGGHGFVEPGQMPLSGDAPGMEPLDMGSGQGPVLASAPTGQGEPWLDSESGDWNAGAAMPQDVSGHPASGPLVDMGPPEMPPDEGYAPHVPPVEGIELASGDVHAPVDAIDDAMGATEQLADAPSHDGGYATGDGPMPSDSDYA